jgi:NADH dehydrogenase FAD-containing subunit
MPLNIVIVGAGQVGVMAALMLDKLYGSQFRIILVGKNSGPLEGASTDDFVSHTTGYYL